MALVRNLLELLVACAAVEVSSVLAVEVGIAVVRDGRVQYRAGRKNAVDPAPVQLECESAVPRRCSVLAGRGAYLCVCPCRWGLGPYFVSAFGVKGTSVSSPGVIVRDVGCAVYDLLLSASVKQVAC